MEEAYAMIAVGRWSLTASGIWPNLDGSWIFGIVSNVVFIISMLITLIFIVIAQFEQLALVGKNLDLIVDLLCTSIIPLNVLYIKWIRLRYKADDVKALLYSMFDDWKSKRDPEERDVMRKYGKSGLRSSAMYSGISYFTCSTWLISRFIFIKQMYELTGIRYLLYSSHFRVNTSESPWWEIVTSAQFFCTFSNMTCNSGINGFFVVLVMHVCGQLVILQSRLRNLGKRGDVRRSINYVIKRHNELKKFAATIERVFSPMFLAQIVGSAVEIGLMGFLLVSMITDKTSELVLINVMFIVFFLSYLTLDLYIYCYIAEKLRTKSIELTDAVYDCKWYEFNPGEIKDLCFMIKSAQNPLECTAGKFRALSIKLFADIARTSMGYLSVLLAVKEGSPE